MMCKHFAIYIYIFVALSDECVPDIAQLTGIDRYRSYTMVHALQQVHIINKEPEITPTFKSSSMQMCNVLFCGARQKLRDPSIEV